MERNRGKSHNLQPVAEEFDEPGQSSEPLIHESEDLQGIAIDHHSGRHTLEKVLDQETVGVFRNFICVFDLAVGLVVGTGGVENLLGEDLLLIQGFSVTNEDNDYLLVQLKIAEAEDVYQEQAENVVAH